MDHFVRLGAKMYILSFSKCIQTLSKSDAKRHKVPHLVVASFSPFLQSHTTMTWLSSSPTLANFFPSPNKHHNIIVFKLTFYKNAKTCTKKTVKYFPISHKIN